MMSVKDEVDEDRNFDHPDFFGGISAAHFLNNRINSAVKSEENETAEWGQFGGPPGEHRTNLRSEFSVGATSEHVSIAPEFSGEMDDDKDFDRFSDSLLSLPPSGSSVMRKCPKMKNLAVRLSTLNPASILHLLSIRTDLAEKFKCGRCEKDCLTKTHLKLHCKKKHRNQNEKPQPLTCEICGRQLTTQSALKNHMLVRHSVEKPFQCQQCEKSFPIQRMLKRHVEYVHELTKDFICSFCGKGFLTLRHLTGHERIHTGEKPYVCKVCRKAFTEPGHLKKHLRVHSDEKPYPCTLCDANFTDYGNMKRHIQTVHEGQKKFTCDVCEQTFSRADHMKEHKNVMHKKAKPYKCCFCRQKFTRRRDCRKHEIKSHAKKKGLGFSPSGSVKQESSEDD